MNKRYGILLFIIAPLAVLALRNHLRTPVIPLIPRSVLFGNPEKVGPSLSPDGTQLAYLAPLTPSQEKAVLNIWVQTLGKNDAHPITNETERSLGSYFWSNDGSEILFLKDSQGDENWRLYGIKLKTQEITNYTPFEQVQTRIIPHKNRETSIILLGLNKDNAESHDVYALDLTTKKLSLVCKNPGKVVQWVADRELTIRAALQELEDGSRAALYRKDAQSNWETVRTYAPEDNNDLCAIQGFSAQHNLLYLTECKGSNTIRFVTYNCTTQEIKCIGEDAEYDVASASIHPETDEIEAIICEKAKVEYRILNQGGLTDRILKAFSSYAGDVHFLSRDKALVHWIIGITSDISAVTYYLYNDKTGEITKLFKARPDLKEEFLAPTEPVSFKSRDGLTLHGYLTYPKNRTSSQVPLVLYVHGGPWYRDSWGYDGTVQWLANRGYAVLQVNFRGSLGYGKKFVNAANKEWGAKMHDDLIDAVNWAIASGIANRKKIAIYGGSYGGYAALCGAAFTPDTFCCAVDIVGPSNLITLIQSFPPYWKAFMKRAYQRIGNPETEAEFLKSRSPLFKADAIKCPLLIAQGAKDPRVTVAESDQIVEALKKHGIQHEYLLFPDEGHGFVNAHNKLKFYAAAEKFLAKHLGGRCED